MNPIGSISDPGQIPGRLCMLTLRGTDYADSWQSPQSLDCGDKTNIHIFRRVCRDCYGKVTEMLCFRLLMESANASDICSFPDTMTIGDVANLL